MGYVYNKSIHQDIVYDKADVNIIDTIHDYHGDGEENRERETHK